MRSPSQLKPADTPLFLDTSVVINLVASRRIEDLRRALNRPFVVEEAVMGEMKRDPRDGSDGTLLMRKLTGDLVLKLTRLDDAQGEHFLRLVGALVPDDLGDGEAATIASALENGSAVIDERKARRIIARDFPALQTFCSLDLLCSEQAYLAMGTDGVHGAVTCALRDGRMRIPPEWRAFVANLTPESNAGPAIT